MGCVTVKNVRIGVGTPKICVSVMGGTIAEIIQSAKAAERSCCDIAEWRADWFPDVFDIDKTFAVLFEVSEILKRKPLIFTYRTSNEGGAKIHDLVNDQDYLMLSKGVIETGFIDLIDVQLSAGDETVSNIVGFARKNGVKVVMSSHDFDGTPPKDEIVSRFSRMKELGADIAKAAFMPNRKQDVINLITAGIEAKESMNDTPLVFISMGEQGAVSRVCGEFAGSAITFGSLGKASAPGQIGADDLRAVLNILTNAK